VSRSPIDQLLEAIDKLDVESVLAMFAPDGQLLTVDGRRANGIDGVRELLQSYLGMLRHTTHRVTAQWHQDDVWIAEVQASYELRDFLRMSGLERALVLRAGAGGITDLHIYGAHERLLSEQHAGSEGLWIGERWVPPL
jgi:hypothetical protein